MSILRKWKSIWLGTRLNIRFVLIVGVLNALGMVIGYRLSSIAGLRTYKLVNLGGLIFTFFGVLVLSEVLTNERWKRFCVTRIAPAILWTHLTIPFGAFVGASVAVFVRKPSASVLAVFSLEYWAYSMLVLAPLNEVVVFPQWPFFKKDVETRWRWMGFLLVLGGVLAQLVAAIVDITW